MEYQKLDEDEENHILYKYLIIGNIQAVEGYLPILLKYYIFFNMILSNYDNYHIQYTCICDHHLPEFIVCEISNIWRIIRLIICYERRKNQYKCNCGLDHMFDITSQPIKISTKEDNNEIKNTCALLLKCLYLCY